MSTLLPLDDNGHPIAILGFVPRGTQKLTVGTASVRSAALTADVAVISLIATGPVRFEPHWNGWSYIDSAASE